KRRVEVLLPALGSARPAEVERGVEAAGSLTEHHLLDTGHEAGAVPGRVTATAPLVGLAVLRLGELDRGLEPLAGDRPIAAGSGHGLVHDPVDEGADDLFGHAADERADRTVRLDPRQQAVVDRTEDLIHQNVEALGLN